LFPQILSTTFCASTSPIISCCAPPAPMRLAACSTSVVCRTSSRASGAESFISRSTISRRLRSRRCSSSAPQPSTAKPRTARRRPAGGSRGGAGEGGDALNACGAEAVGRSESAGKEMVVADVALHADPAGALYWPEHGLLAVADLHLEKGSSYAVRGVLLPP